MIWWLTPATPLTRMVWSLAATLSPLTNCRSPSPQCQPPMQPQPKSQPKCQPPMQPKVELNYNHRVPSSIAATTSHNHSNHQCNHTHNPSHNHSANQIFLTTTTQCQTLMQPKPQPQHHRSNHIFKTMTTKCQPSCRHNNSLPQVPSFLTLKCSQPCQSCCWCK